VPTDCVVNFDNLHTVPRSAFRRKITSLSSARGAEVCRVLAAATGC
jgi:mRNA interferase MazF